MTENSNQSALARGLAVLERVVNAERPVSSAELAEELGLPKPTVHRLAQQLEEIGILRRDPASKRFIGGARLRDIAVATLSNTVLSAPRHAILQSLSDEIGETCNCTIMDGNDLVYFDRVEANWPYRIHLPIGSRLPLYCTASGKLFLAHLKPAQRRRVLTSVPLQRLADNTITDLDVLEKEILKIRDAGIAVDNQEYMPGLISLAVPVIDASNHMAFAIAVHSPTIRKTLDELRQYVPVMRRAAAAMAADLNTITE